MTRAHRYISFGLAFAILLASPVAYAKDARSHDAPRQTASEQAAPLDLQISNDNSADTGSTTSTTTATSTDTTTTTAATTTATTTAQPPAPVASAPAKNPSSTNTAPTKPKATKTPTPVSTRTSTSTATTSASANPQNAEPAATAVAGVDAYGSGGGTPISLLLLGGATALGCLSALSFVRTRSSARLHPRRT